MDVFAAILFSGVCVLASCSKDEDSTNSTKPGPLAGKLNGTWYSIYEATGTAKAENSGVENAAYTSVIDIYHFNESGRGDFQRCFFNDQDLDPVLVHGILGYGDFNYNSTDDGKVNITLTNNFGQAYPKTWKLNYANNETATITGQGVDGQVLTFQRANKDMEEALNRFVEQNGLFKRLYETKDYKPQGVDNSKWMKTLDDNRLVADLSLPGSHDACTADGWNVLATVAELTAKTQDLTVKEQLKVGMRVFDLRPERVHKTKSYELRCSHGIMSTNLLVSDFFRTLKEFLATNPSEFCVLTVELSATSDKKAWGNEFSQLIASSEFKDMFVNFKPRLTVGEMRGHVLMLSREEYAAKPTGGYCYGWVKDQEFEKQTKGHITGPDGVETPLWVQDFWGKLTSDGKGDAVVRMLEAAAARDMTVATPAWVINYTSAYFGLPLSDSYRDNAEEANILAVKWLDSHSGPVGIIYMDFAGMDKTPNFSGLKLYEANSMALIDRIIKQNQK